MRIYLATNETPSLWMLDPNERKNLTIEEAERRILELDDLKAIPFVWIDEKKKFLPLRAYEKGKKPKIQDFNIIIKWEI
jgi:hypothetical protein